MIVSAYGAIDPYGGNIELFLVPPSVLRLVCAILSVGYKRTHAADMRR